MTWAILALGAPALLMLLALGACGDGGGRSGGASSAESCMTCHNGSQQDDYSGPGLEDPHPYGAAAELKCTTCHGGNPKGGDKESSHVPPPPEIGDDAQQITDREAYFNRLTLTGLDQYADYTVGGKTYTALDFLQFINPGDLRVVAQGVSCGQCHDPHSDSVSASVLATSDGIFSGAMFGIGADAAVPENQLLFEDTASSLGFRDITDPAFVLDPADVGAVGRLLQFPVYSVFGLSSPTDLHNNAAYDALAMGGDLEADNQVVTGSNLANVYQEQIAFTCGDCHLGSAGANNRYGDFRSSGCTACHMRYSLSGRSGTGDPNVNLFEPLNPDNILAPEQPHPDRHLIRSIFKTLPSGESVQGIDDYTCAGCHQGSNRTVMQYWGIRLDQNQDLRNGNQYPAAPVSYQDTSGDPRLFDPAVGNNTFNGRNRRQYIAFEDYDGDTRDDTPADVHYEAGMGCIDCHGSYDLHGGDTSGPNSGTIASRMEQAVAIACEDCHGATDAYAQTVAGTDYGGQAAELAMDSQGNPLRHVAKEGDGNYYLTSRLTGARHFVPQTLDTVVNNGTQNPFTLQPVYTDRASYAMGRKDGNATTGIGPQQTGGTLNGFSHTDNMDCASCHASWTNTCMGCHLEGEYSTNPNNFSNITGDRIVFREDNADFVYQSPVPFQLGVGPRNKISAFSSNTKMFFQYEDLLNNRSETFAFSDRKGLGNSTAATPYPSLSHNAMMAHSIRGRVEPTQEGPRYCVACHLTDDGLTNFGTEYDTFRTAMATDDFASLDFNLLQTHIGSNPGNQLDSPLWVHMVAGLGSGLFLFDEHGCPVNPLDDDANRKGCDGTSPQAAFDLANVAFNLDRIVNESGVPNGGNNHPLLNPGVGPNLRDGALFPNMAGPLGMTLLQRLTDPTSGIVLNSWLDADGQTQGNASTYIP